MRCLSLILVVAACGDATEEGAIITVRAPSGPATADRLDLVLASSDASSISEITGQRAQPGDVIEHVARYYRQRSTAGSVGEVGAVDGFIVRIEPNTAVSADEQFIPFVIAQESIDGELHVTGIGVVLDGNGEPAPISIEAGKLERYFVDMVPLAEAAPDAAIARGESLAIACRQGDVSLFRSGIAWQPNDAAQLRLLLPDTSVDPDETDASSRALDLDCDQHDVPDEDCDDLRNEYFVGNAETCDGFDTNCDGSRFELVPCQLPPGTCGPSVADGVGVCLDRDGGDMGACTGDPQCLCANGNPGPCTKCILGFQGTPNEMRQRPCAPAVGELTLTGCQQSDPCTVEVIHQPSQPWVASVSITSDGPFLPKITGVVSKVNLHVKLLGTQEVDGVAASSVGEVFLSVSNSSGRRNIGVDLQLTSGGESNCTIGAIESMLCSP